MQKLHITTDNPHPNGWSLVVQSRVERFSHVHHRDGNGHTMIYYSIEQGLQKWAGVERAIHIHANSTDAINVDGWTLDLVSKHVVLTRAGEHLMRWHNIEQGLRVWASDNDYEYFKLAREHAAQHIVNNILRLVKNGSYGKTNAPPTHEQQLNAECALRKLTNAEWRNRLQVMHRRAQKAEAELKRARAAVEIYKEYAKPERFGALHNTFEVVTGRKKRLTRSSLYAMAYSIALRRNLTVSTMNQHVMGILHAWRMK